MTYSTTNLFSFLRGQWTLARSVTDFRDEKTFSLKGIASYEGDFPILIYNEEGKGIGPQFENDFFQSYTYKFNTISTADILFTDGRFFHELCLEKGPCLTEHKCNQDIYQGSFTCLSHTQLKMCWHVKGPRKDYEIISTYIKQ
ncbi:MAG: hypothetical protein HON43_01795 [Alphaproteobacteria bacterium]|jgi:hypothetical protein|nr:hypothetical protein [Alphaproteobacteria bacterium]MBT5390644.1 hypothetical protein [Alphaproteobacteria bacterium]MBT5540891.1 hypothetical protein [Alphaproteobacteria bacterium]